MSIKIKYEKLQLEFNDLQAKYDALTKEKEELEVHLKKYTAPKRAKKYYQEHKEEIKQKVKEYNEKTNYAATVSKDKKQEYNRKSYQKRKEKLKNICVQNT